MPCNFVIVFFDDDINEALYLRLHLLVMKHGTSILKSTFDNKIPKNKLKQELQKQKNLVKHYKKPYHNMLYPNDGDGPNSDDFDMLLLFMLLRDISGLNKRSRWWNVTQNDNIHIGVHDEVADIVRLKNLRNKLCQMNLHGLDQVDLQIMWNQARDALLRLASACHIENFRMIVEAVGKSNLLSNQFRSLKESTSQFLLEYDNEGKAYVETSAFKKAKDILEEHHFVVLSGHRGEGKTSMAVKLALSISDRDNCLLLHEPSDWRRHDDLTLKLTKTIIIDDLYGSTSLNQRSVSDWRVVLKDIHRAARQRRIYVIITCVTYILKQSDEEIGAIREVLDNEINICQLTSSELTEPEKIEIIKAHAEKSSRNISKKMILECVDLSSCQNEAFLCGFPQRVSEFCKNDQLYKIGSQYFKAPYEGVIKYLKHMYKKGGDSKDNDKFLAFLLVWGKREGKLNRRELEVTTASKHVKCILELFGRPLNNTVVKTMLLSLESHVGGFLKYNEKTGDFSFSHGTICDAVGLAFGPKEPAILLEIILRDFFMHYTGVVGNTDTSDQCKIVFDEDMFPSLVKKCCSMLLNPEECENDDLLNQSSELLELERYGKCGNTLCFRNLIDFGIIKHSAFNSTAFVNTFLQYVVSEGLVNDVFDQLILSMSGRFLDYGLSVTRLDMRLLDYALFSGAEEFAEGVLSSGIVGAKWMNLEMSLLLAIHSKRVRLIQLLLDRGARVTGDAIHIAVYSSSNVLEMLLRQPDTNINDRGNGVNGDHPLIVAANKSMYKAVKCLLSHGADPGVHNAMNMTALHKAILLQESDNKREKIISILIKHGSPLDIRGGTFKRTPLHIAVEIGDAALVQTLIRQGASLYVSDKMGQFPLHTAIMRGYVEIVKMLLRVDRSQETLRMTLNRQNRRTGWSSKRKASVMRGLSVFHTAIWRRNEIVDTLISLSTDPNVTDCYGRTPLLYAIEEKHTDVALKLMRYFKVNKRQADKQGRTPLHIALQNELDDLATQLIPDSDVNAKDKAGQTPLHIACTKLNIPAIGCLLRYAADFTMVTNNGDTVFHILTRRPEGIANHVIQFFLQFDPKIVDYLPHLKNKEGQILYLTPVKTGLRRYKTVDNYLRRMANIYRV